MAIVLPSVVSDFDGQCAAIDQAIREAAEAFQFYYEREAPLFNEIQTIPQVIYQLIKHYTLRGFICVYDGDAGKLKFYWDHPNMSYLEHSQVTRAVPSMIPQLGIGFRASLLYLCMTNNSDLRKHSDVTLQRSISEGIKEAAALGNTELEFGFPEVPAPVVSNLFRATFDLLEASEFTVMFNVQKNVFVIRWGDTLEFKFASGESGQLGFAP